jgi:hypothetical protein
MKFLNTFFVILILAFSSRAATTLSGRIINATHDSSGVAAVTVNLQKMTAQQQMPVQITTTQSNRSGGFSFDITDIDVSATYFAAIDFQGVRYFSDGTQPGSAAPDLSVIVYDSTHSANGVEAFMHHIIIDDFGDLLQFRETRVLSNPNNKSITEAVIEEHIGPALFQFNLPAGALNFTPLSSRTNEELIQHGRFVIDRGIFLPGNKTISFGYELPMRNKSLPVTINATHAAKTFDLFISSDNIEINSPLLTDNGPFEIRGTKYHRYGVANVDAGTDIQFTVRRVGRADHEQSPTVAIALTAGLLLIGLAVGYMQKDKSAATTDKSDLPARKKELIAQIAQLDAKGDNSDKEQRQALMIELQNIELQLTGSKKSRAKK